MPASASRPVVSTTVHAGLQLASRHHDLILLRYCPIDAYMSIRPETEAKNDIAEGNRANSVQGADGVGGEPQGVLSSLRSRSAGMLIGNTFSR